MPGNDRVLAGNAELVREMYLLDKETFAFIVLLLRLSNVSEDYALIPFSELSHRPKEASEEGGRPCPGRPLCLVSVEHRPETSQVSIV